MTGPSSITRCKGGADRKATGAQIKTLTSASPTLVTPTLGVATATSINGLTITTTTGTLTITNGKTLAVTNSLTIAGTDGKTLTVSNSLTLAGTDSTTMTFPPASASIGYLGLPSNGQNAGYTAVLADAGKVIIMQTAGTFTIPANGSVAYSVGTVLTFANSSTSQSIAITTDTMTLAGTATTGTRTLAANGIATALKVASTAWFISGSGLT